MKFSSFIVSGPLFISANGVLDCVINRVVACLRGNLEQTLWQGETSHTIAKKVGIEQGCPLSPYILNLVMDALLSNVEEDLDLFG